MTGEKKIVSGKRRKIRISHILFLLLFVVAGSFIFFRFNTKRKLREKIEAIRAAGYPVNSKELDEWYSIPDDTENVAYVILDAVEYYHQDQNDFEILPFVGNAEVPKRNKPLSEDVMKHASQFLDDNKKCLELLHKIAELKYGRYPIDLNYGFDTLLSHLSQINNSMKLLQLDAVYHADCNEPELVINSIETGFGLYRSLTLEPVMISQYSCSNIKNRICLILERIMNRLELQDEELLRLQELFKENNEFSEMFRGLIGQRCIILDVLRNIKKFDKESLGIDLPSYSILEAYEALGLMDREALLYLDLKQEYLKVFEIPPHERQSASKVVSDKTKTNSTKFLFVHNFIHDLYNLTETNLRNIAEFRNAQTALVVERYRLAENKLPNSLDNLVPGYLESVPLDTFDGKQIRYKKLDKGFVVYSIGEDQIDDGGKELKKDSTRKSGDTWDITFIVEK